MAKTRERIDKILVEKGLVKSREMARAFIMEGRVTVGGVPFTKPGSMVEPSTEIEVKGADMPYVSRGGLKLEAALDHFGVDPSNKVVMDIGASTGGFTDCVLKRGAKKVYAVDVGYGQLDWSLRNDPRIVLFERTNIRHLEKEAVPDRIDIVLIDASFISLLKVLPKTMEFLDKGGIVLALVKPQFEVGRGMVGKGGIVRDEGRRLSAVESVRGSAEELGFITLGLFESPVRGQKGNIEYFLYLGRK